jgi:type 1 glutamine amidotransferase
VKEGKGFLFLHHSICSFQEWNEYKSFTGGKYYEKKKDEVFGASSYQHDVKFSVHILDNSHPVTRGIKDFEILDEVYGNLEVLPEVQPLLSTDHPKSYKLIGWTLKKENSRIVYIEPGHDKNAWFNPSYQTLIKQAISYIAGK